MLKSTGTIRYFLALYNYSLMLTMTLMLKLPRLLLHFSLLLIFTSAQAQTEKKSRLLGGSGSYNFEFDTPIRRANFMGRVGYFVGNNFAVGIVLPVTYTSLGERNTVYTTYVGGQLVNYERQRSSLIGIGPFIRKYYGSASFRPFLQAQVSYLRATTATKVVDQEVTRSTSIDYNLAGGVGLAYFPNRYVGIEGTLNGNFSVLNRQYSPSQIGFNFGILFYLPGSSE